MSSIINQETLAKEMNASLKRIKLAKSDDFPKELGNIEAMLITWLIKMDKLDE